MKTYTLHRAQVVPRRVEEVFEFFSHAGNLQALTPPWLDFRMVNAPGELQAGSLIRYQLRIHMLPIRWTSEITAWQPPHRFVDVQLSGPYTLWHHEHKFSPDPRGTIVEDTVQYALPLGILGQIGHWGLVRRDLKNVFDYRAAKMRELFGE